MLVRTILRLLLCTGCVLRAQVEPEMEAPAINLLQQQMGVTTLYQSRAFTNLTMNTLVTAAALEYLLPSGTTASAALGLNKLTIPRDKHNSAEMQGKLSLYLQAGLYHRLKFLYARSGIMYYRTTGKAVEARVGQSTVYTYTNKYVIYEYPFELGLVMNLRRFTLWTGATKSYFYGSNEVVLEMTSGTARINLGTLSSTFIDNLPPALVLNLAYNLQNKYTLMLGSAYNPAGYTTLMLSFWSGVALSPAAAAL